MTETFKGIWRNKVSSFLSSVTTAFALFLLGISFLLNLNLGFMVQSAERQMEIQAYLQKDVDSKKAQQIADSVRTIQGVLEVQYISKEQAFEELKAMFGDKSSVLAGLDENPLPASIRIKVQSSQDVPGIVEKLKQIPEFNDVVYQEEVARRLASLSNMVRLFSVGGVLMVGFVAAMVIGNSIKLTIDARRHEISIMKLVGATDRFITGPFILQGIVLGVSGAILGCALAAALYVWVLRMVMQNLPFIPVISLDLKTAGDMFVIMLITGIVVGAGGSALSIRRHLQV